MTVKVRRLIDQPTLEVRTKSIARFVHEPSGNIVYLAVACDESGEIPTRVYLRYDGSLALVAATPDRLAELTLLESHDISLETVVTLARYLLSSHLVLEHDDTNLMLSGNVGLHAYYTRMAGDKATAEAFKLLCAATTVAVNSLSLVIAMSSVDAIVEFHEAVRAALKDASITGIEEVIAQWGNQDVAVVFDPSRMEMREQAVEVLVFVAVLNRVAF